MKIKFPASDAYPAGAELEFTPGTVSLDSDKDDKPYLVVKDFHIKSSKGIPKAIAFGCVLFMIAQACNNTADEICETADEEFLAKSKLNTFEDIE